MAISLSDAGTRNRLINVLMRVRIIFIVPPQHLQRIAGRASGGGSTTRLRSCTSGISLLLGCKKPKLRARRKQHGTAAFSAEDWSAIQETLYLLAVPGMRESIKTGMAEPLAKSSKALKW